MVPDARAFDAPALGFQTTMTPQGHISHERKLECVLGPQPMIDLLADHTVMGVASTSEPRVRAKEAAIWPLKTASCPTNLGIG